MKIVLLIPYYGNLPEYIRAFLRSCEPLKGKINFKIFTDDEMIHDLEMPDNVSYELNSFEWMKIRIREKGFGRIYSPYKLCDYKPLYGVIFDDYISEYEYWGYCDVDTMLGDIPRFLTENSYKDYDRIGSQGHFTIYRNSEDINNLWRTKLKKAPKQFDFQFVAKTAFPCHFDEVGMNAICDEKGISFLQKNFQLQTSILRDYHLHTRKPLGCELFVYENGRVFLYTQTDTCVSKKEFMYVHFQDRKIMPTHFQSEHSNILITHLGFLPFDESRLNEYFVTYGSFDTIEEREKYLDDCYLRLHKSQKERIFRELKYCGVKSLYNLYQRLCYRNWLKKNNLF